MITPKLTVSRISIQSAKPAMMPRVLLVPRTSIITRHAVHEGTLAHAQTSSTSSAVNSAVPFSSTCSTSTGSVTSSGCGKGSCGGGCSSNSNSAVLAGLGQAQGLGSMSTMMSNHVGLSRTDIEEAFKMQPAQATPVTGERVLSISELLASCPDDLIWGDEDDDNDQ